MACVTQSLQVSRILFCCNESTYSFFLISDDAMVGGKSPVPSTLKQSIHTGCGPEATLGCVPDFISSFITITVVLGHWEASPSAHRQKERN
jgi:hypothetical protein